MRHLRSYLSSEDDVLNVLQYHQNELVRLVHTQMNQHYLEKATEYQVSATKGFQTLTRATPRWRRARGPEISVNPSRTGC